VLRNWEADNGCVDRLVSIQLYGHKQMRQGTVCVPAMPSLVSQHHESLPIFLEVGKMHFRDSSLAYGSPAKGL